MDEVGFFWLEYRILAVLLNNKTAKLLANSSFADLGSGPIDEMAAI
jgi:hypothetical protein